MKILPKVEQNEMVPGLLYVGAMPLAMEGAEGCADRDEMHFYGPVGGLQITHGGLRDPADGEFYGRYDPGAALWVIDQHARRGGRPPLYADVFLTWITREGDPVEQLRAQCLALSQDLARAKQAMQSMAALMPRATSDRPAAEPDETLAPTDLDCPYAGIEADAARDLAVLDALGDVLGCGQECLCPGCREDIQGAMALMLGISPEETENG